MSRTALFSSVALLEDVPGRQLTKGQIGTVVERLERDGEEALLVEFSGDEGQRVRARRQKSEIDGRSFDAH